MNQAPSFDPRRRWLLQSGATCASALGLGSMGNLLLTTERAQAQTAGYKALVCVFLYGGNDGLNTVVPTDAARHAQYSAVRGPLAIPRDKLVAIPGMQFGFHPSLSALSAAAGAGNVAPVFNVGPLYSPLTKAAYRAEPNGSIRKPEGLFSHSDQQVLWETGTTRSQERTGWGGRASAALGTANPVISVGGSARFGLTTLQSTLVLPGPGSTFGAYGIDPTELQWAPNAARKAALDVMYAAAQDTALANAYAKQQRDAFMISQRLGALVKVTPGGAGSNAVIDAAFAPITAAGKITSDLGQQLYQVAKLVVGNATVQGNRQIFFAQAGGFDTHADQVAGDPVAGQHAGRLKEVGDALAAFYTAMKNLGMGSQVTTFTQSDFGRTFKPNSSNGTDHAWGNTHLVIGGAVKGTTTYGTYPELVLGGADDVGTDAWELEGRWIPTTSVDQYAATLLTWFGASDAQLDQSLPNLRNFGANRRLAFV
jgi:uncharacterized protein (DUF1501 family)